MPRSARAAAAATLAVSTAGWVLAVRVSSVSGPSKQRRDSENPSASSASRQTAAAATEASASSRPIPTACDPCPGNRNATLMPSSALGAGRATSGGGPRPT